MTDSRTLTYLVRRRSMDLSQDPPETTRPVPEDSGR